MSSHHIIRDEQEPALILEDLDSFPMDLLGQLLEWAPFTICEDFALEQALDYGINLDVVISSRENLNELLGHFPGVIVLNEDEDKLSQAIDFLTNRGHKAVNVVTSDPFNRFEWMHKRNEKLLVDVITPTRKFICVAKEFTKWMAEGTMIMNAENKRLLINSEEFNESKFEIKKEGTITVSSFGTPFILGLSL